MPAHQIDFTISIASGCFILFKIDYLKVTIFCKKKALLKKEGHNIKIIYA